MDRIESGTRLLVYVDPSVPDAEAHQRVASARDRLGLEPIDIVRATPEQMHNDVAEHEYSHLLDIGPGEPTAEYLGVWMTLDELEGADPGR
jgi:hypothetical protein